MYSQVKNLVFEGGGILGISYLGVLDYLDELEMLSRIEKIAGTSAGAIVACIASFNTSFNEIKRIASSLDYRRIPQKEAVPLRGISDNFKVDFEKMFGDINSIYRLLNNYGWFSTGYLYSWIKKIIANQFDQEKKKPPYTFEDFKNTDIHVNKRPFKDLYIVGTDISYKTSAVFSASTTPKMEVAEAVRISMAIPLYFEAVKTGDKLRGNEQHYVYADGGIMRNFPINIFDNNGFNPSTLGVRFKNKIKYSETNNIVDYISNLFNCFLKVQEDIYNNDITNQRRTIVINTGGISPLDFDIDEKDYKFLYKQGYDATSDYFEEKDRFTY